MSNPSFLVISTYLTMNHGDTLVIVVLVNIALALYTILPYVEGCSKSMIKGKNKVVALLR